jgi:hypothetical protein
MRSRGCGTIAASPLIHMNTTTIGGETKRIPRWIGFVLLFGGFISLCTVFSLVVTAGVAWQEHSEAQWPEATASVQQCSVESAGQRSGSNIIVCRISYRVGNETINSHVHSMSSRAPEKVVWEFHPGQAQEIFNEMQDWVDAHPPGTLIAIHYNPSNQTQAVLVATDMPLGGPQTLKNVKLTGETAVISAALLAVGTILRRLWAR